MDTSQALSVKDVIKDSFLSLNSVSGLLSTQTILQMAMALILSLLACMGLYWVYKKTFRGVVFSTSFGVPLIGMTVLTTMIVLAISTNVVLSLGMVGALSIVRYRTAIKEPMDLLFLFWGITLGITVGAGMYILALIASLVLTGLLFFFGKGKPGRQVYVLVVHYTGDDITDEIIRILGRTKYVIKSKTLRKDMSEMALEINVQNSNLSAAERIRDLDRVRDLTVIAYNGEYHE